MTKLNAKQLRALRDEGIADKIDRRPLYFILDNIYDTYNIGGLFRLADALAVSKLYICGKSDTPPNHKIQKASIGTYKVVPWEYHKKTTVLLSNLKFQISNLQLVAIEQDKKAIPYTEFTYTTPLAFVVGHETDGVSKEVLNMCDAIVDIPMHGINTSLNVIVATAIVAYYADQRLTTNI
ncbi:hypothetical protein A3H80_00965 [Candidatus Roizmanbacteria bacterium RIFCSPLOWO2_02_FULL_37_19]|uniref:tRNA/rRNA methyltransferase SpoU type domain-containing protein n=1 Tax=Candidatus Roizmanbacteria bacterium RIFCSPHIGHO2_02_FULL_37_24 TaxID=1802037 RepID=A0A1F7GTW9_9BACT|nr:MAG: hypothetical protein A2862_04230 [Candidatus Roizmanbacteria bacterium RIFCSPHIGHO2_01_FULL_38_41]OGK22507.1 MAG: hypothetical protein A3C24_05080 [Candidatus Roizmanbacteria bacterium RIFCSPHIGHO2_02_FULL_37_24]OGK33907.1 MAG: hypothetical protein A3E10_01865 [Candidatus Roizmanbacteria bacterium RIFCSPHIGHO2_12_FULL_37_23]OGK43504.1 MAG: hypothetical protein A2956_02155 [Candidatus Roizmanbacteria bacterium RIFCSPLOWO2_01_FULL_37_57]OGK54171.1 MAG: hypothetical protein A3H80_00965 [Ca